MNELVSETPEPTGTPEPVGTPEATATPEPVGQPDAFAAPEPQAFGAPQPAKPAGRGLALKATAAVAAAVLAGVGIGVGIIQVKYQDDTTPVAAPAPSAAPSGAPAPSGPAYGAQSNGTHFGAMRDLLLPMPAGYVLGPDDDVYGNDTELSQDAINTYLDDRVKDLPKDQRDKVKNALKAEGHKGAGVRSYRAADSKMVVTLWLDQFNQKSVAVENAFQGAWGSESGLFRQGPEVPGHQDARCFLPPAKPSEPIDELECTAAIGDLLVTMHVEGVAPLPKSEAVSIFRQQLERLALPGASV
ncbi:hypothetical protein [Kitasatospora azatica]|uniref:hypothetical protein n=1 Tax=Kitasatospora azatica TaxID=58347 RepID=UPI0005679D00|nr:hypothetical protein [Kitasatospora azatica]